MQFKNEQDILEPFLRHHSPFFDAILVLNNGSADQSTPILNNLVRELPNVICIDAPTQKNELARSISHVFRQAQSAFFADFVFFLDADEFIGAPNPAAFDAMISKIKFGRAGRMAWRTFVPDPALDETKIPDPIQRLTHRRIKERTRPSTSKSFVRLGGAFNPAHATEQGNHKMRTGLNFSFSAKILQDLPLFHLPIRSIQQARAKGIIGWASYLARGDLAMGGGGHWKILSEEFAAQNEISSNALTDMAMRYGTRYPIGDFTTNAVRDDHGLPLIRRYSNGDYGDTDSLIAAALDPQPMRSQTFALPALSNIDAPPLQFLMARLAPERLLEVAFDQAGYGRLCAFHGAKHVESLVDFDHQALAAPIHHPLAQEFDLKSQFDVVVALGMAADSRAYYSIARHATASIITSGADVPAALKAWAMQGWYPDLLATLGARACATLADLHRTMLVLRPTQDQGASEKLCQIANYPHYDYPQTPRLRLSVFEDPFPDMNEGYGLRQR